MTSPPTRTSTGVRLTRIRIYPLKGAAGYDLREATVEPSGIPGDRRWMLVGPGGDFLSQRTHPRLCLIRTGSEPGGEPSALRFEVRAPGLPPLILAPPPQGEPMEVRLHGERFVAMAGGPEDDEWFAEFLGQPCRLVFLPVDNLRKVDPAFASGHRVALADGYPLHLTAEESLEQLNRRLSRDPSMLRYRPNIVVAGGEPWEEDEWRLLGIGGASLRVVKPCARCSVTTVDPGTAIRGREPLRAMRRFRVWEGKAYFGQNLVVEETGRFRVGDIVHILEKGSRRPPLPA